jgi:hypothetical protein
VVFARALIPRFFTKAACGYPSPTGGELVLQLTNRSDRCAPATRGLRQGLKIGWDIKV